MEYNYVKKELGEKVLQSHGSQKQLSDTMSIWMNKRQNFFLMEYNYVKKKIRRKALQSH